MGAGLGVRGGPGFRYTNTVSRKALISTPAPHPGKKVVPSHTSSHTYPSHRSHPAAAAGILGMDEEGFLSVTDHHNAKVSSSQEWYTIHVLPSPLRYRPHPPFSPHQLSSLPPLSNYHLFLQTSAVALMEFSKAMLQTSRNVSMGLFNCSCQFEFAIGFCTGYYIFFSQRGFQPSGFETAEQ